MTFDFAEVGSSVITGFTITGRGIYCYGTSPTISKNIIRDCANNGVEGQSNAAPIISANTIKSNAGLGIHSCNGPISGNTISGNNGGITGCDGPITDNVVSNNSNFTPGLGGGLFDCRGEITGNTIANNYASIRGGGLYACDGNISNNDIVGNRANSEGGGLLSCLGNIGNNIIAGNVSSSGGGLYGCNGYIYNNTIVGNRASFRGGAICNCGGFVLNNILAFNEATEVGGIYGPCNNSYNGLWTNQIGNFGGGAVPGKGDAVINPLFAVNGQWDGRGTPDPSDDIWIDGDYHVKSKVGRWDPASQLWVKDNATSHSLCIDAGDPNSDWTAELWPHGKCINLGAYGGTPQASMSTSLVGNVADIDDDGLVDFNDMLLLTEMWLSDQVLLAEDLNRDRIVNLVDFAILVGNWRPGPPMPNPMTWATPPPYATSPYSIAMIATTATSTDWSGVEYYFEDFEHPQFNSGWLSFAPGQQPMWEDTGLTPVTKYWYRVKTRNKLNRLETGWSQPASATTPQEDTTPPMPDPMTWATPPYVTSPTSIRMVATTAYDNSGVQYFFECTSDANYNSSWQDSPTYDVNSLPKGVYTFVVRAQDKSPNHNTTGNSTAVTVDLKPPTPDPMTWATPPYATSSTSIRMVATTASDDSGVQYFFECTSHPSYSSSWQDSPTYEATSLPMDIYTFVARAQDNSPNHNTTADSNAVTIDLRDQTAPKPDPMDWATDGEPKEVYGGGGWMDYYAVMTAAAANDESGVVEYYFQCTSDDRYSSDGWISFEPGEPCTYTVCVGQKNRYFYFRVKARDLYHNETDFSEALPMLPSYE
jgi:hypothetical protein